MQELSGRTAFITGGASGIGLGMARAFGRAGMRVVLADIEEKVAKSAAEQLAAQQIKVTPIICDVAEAASTPRCVLHEILFISCYTYNY